MKQLSGARILISRRIRAAIELGRKLVGPDPKKIAELTLHLLESDELLLELITSELIGDLRRSALREGMLAILYAKDPNRRAMPASDRPIPR
jgi:hypothetical protein